MLKNLRFLFILIVLFAVSTQATRVSAFGNLHSFDNWPVRPPPIAQIVDHDNPFSVHSSAFLAPKPTKTPTATPTSQTTQSTDGSITLGETNILGNDDSGNGNMLVAQQVVLSQAATIQSMSFYVGTASGNLRLGIYNDASGKPHSLLAQTAEFTPVVGWNTQNVQTPVLLAAGTYWLAYLPQSNNLYYRMATSGSAYYYSYTYGALPGTFSSSPTSGAYHWSFYATLIVSATPTPGATATPTRTPTGTSAPTSTPVVTATPTRTSTGTSTAIYTATPTGTTAVTATSTRTPTGTSTAIYTATPTGTTAVTATPTRTPSGTTTSAATPTRTATGAFTATSTATPTPSKTPTPTAMGTNSPTPTTNPTGNTAWPIKVSANGRYLTDQNNAPYLIKGDSAHGLFGAVSLTDAGTYLSSRHAAGLNTAWVQLLCSPYSSICPGYTTYDGIAPFSWNGSNPDTFDLASPNGAYFSRIDAMLNLAALNNITIFLNPVDTGGLLSVLRANGVTKAYNFGVYLGNRYKNFPNIIWMSGNDFQSWSTPSDDALVQAVANGIKSVDTNHLQTVELDFDTSGSLDDSSWTPIINLDTSYSYYPEYAQTLTEYNRAGMPVWFIEGVYEYQGYQGGYLGPYTLRNQEYWVMLSGATGQLYGNANLYGFPSGWQSTDWQTSPGITQFMIANNFFSAVQWYNLVPDQNHSVVTAGYGTYQNCCINQNSNYLTAARTADGSLVIAYLPTVRTFTVDMSKLSGTVTARWFDPTNGAYQTVSGSPFANSGSRQFTPPGNNASGDGDWVLILQSGSGPTPTITPTPNGTLTATPTRTATGTAAPTSTAVSPTPGAITIGETNILSGDDSGNGNMLVAQQVTLAQNATLQSLSFYVGIASGNLHLGIYSDASGKPNTLLAQTAEFTSLVGWNTQNVQTPVLLAAGTYWLVYLPQSGNLHYRMATSGAAYYYNYTYAALPGTFSSSPTSGAYHWSFYATLTVGP